LKSSVLCVGEILWDALPVGLFPGGAPFNDAIHMNQLGLDAVPVSSVGNDELGRELTRRVSRHGLSDAFVQIHDNLPTGFVIVTLRDETNPQYEIVQPSAWDEMELTDSLQDAASRCQAVVFGSLGQRSEKSRHTIRAIINDAQYRIYDVNFRRPFVDRKIIEQGMLSSELVKLNFDELKEIKDWYRLDGDDYDVISFLVDKFKIETFCVTRGDQGATIYHRGELFEHDGFKVNVADAVGAGDAFLASLVSGFLKNDQSTPDEILERANATGAWVASQNGATPQLDREAIDQLIHEHKVASHGRF